MDNLPKLPEDKINELANTSDVQQQDFVDTAQKAVGKVFEDLKNGKIKSFKDIFKIAYAHVSEIDDTKKALAANPTETKTLTDGK